MDQLLASLLSNDNALRRQAEQEYHALKASRSQEVIVSLSQLASGYLTSPDHIRVISCILLRGITIREQELWGNIDGAIFDAIRAEFLVRASTGTNIFVNQKLCDIIAPLAKLKPWPELCLKVEELLSAAKTASEVQVGFYLVDKLCEYRVSEFVNSYSTILRLVDYHIAKNDSNTQRLASHALLSCLLEINVETLNSDETIFISKVMLNFIEVLPHVLHNTDDSEILSNIEKLSSEKPSLLVYKVSTPKESFFTQVNLFSSDVGFSGGEISTSLALYLFEKARLICETNSFPEQSRLSALELATSLAINKFLPIQSNPENWTKFVYSVSQLVRYESFDDGEYEDSLSSYALQALETMSMSLNSDILMNEALSVANTFLASGDSSAISSAFLIVSSIAPGTKGSLYGQLKGIVERLLQALGDSNEIIILSSLDCLGTLIEEYNGDNSQEDEDDEDAVFESVKHDTMKSVQQIFPDAIPSGLSKLLQTSSTFSQKVLTKALECVRIFFNPDKCSKKACKPYAASLIEFCISLLSNNSYDLAVRQEAASIIANMSVLSPKKTIQAKYRRIIDLINSILVASPQILASDSQMQLKQQSMDQIQRETNILKGKCLECFAILGKAVGFDLFNKEACEMIGKLVGMINAGLDYSDPLSSYIVQSCVRIAGVLGETFQPYLPSVIPPLLAHVSQPLTVEITDDTSIPNSESMFDQSTESHKMYQRGVGYVSVKYSSHEIVEKETALRVLYQYYLDIPSYLPAYIPDTIKAVVHIFSSPTATDDLYLISCAILSEVIEILLSAVQSCESDVSIALTDLVNVAVVNVMRGWERSQAIESHKHTPSETVYILVDGLREIYEVIFSCAGEGIEPIRISDIAIENSIQLIQNEVVILTQRRLVDQIVQTREEDIKVEDETLNSLQDCASWLIKIARDRLMVSKCFTEQFVPFLQSLVTSGIQEDALLQAPIMWLLDIIEYVPSMRQTLCPFLLPRLLALYDMSETLIPCVYGFGVIGQYYEGAIPSEQCVLCLQIISHFSGLKNSDTPVISFDLDDEQENLIRDNSISALFKMILFQTNVVKAYINVDDALSVVLSLLPLTNDLFEARALHATLVTAVGARNMILFGYNFRNLPDILKFLAKLSVCVSITEENHTSNEFWSEQIVSKETYTRARYLLSEHGKDLMNIPSSNMEAAIRALPQDISFLLKIIK